MDRYSVRRAANGWELVRDGEERACRFSGSKVEILRIVGRFLEGQTASVAIYNADGSYAGERVYPMVAKRHKNASAQKARGS
ncbi:DUF2188 domain-containing protein [Pseudomonas kuykendallii]|uniref:DUF2188 domain-containing protein n=1 Tax=Pseudomonas kuykendallii TaxID=1007099 RepID=A0A2W5EXZ3_9PSED|nr:DUF2188 domain-containing protein [Pseudomonas kuykendallii]PZP25006.1 MAG: hypothetical protein DI599_07250 [Pseudomonas kuykendallii]